MMLAPLPPSSRLTRLTDSAAALLIATPARVEPVKLTMSTSGCAVRCAPTPAPSPFTRLNTPGGKPAASIISASNMALSGACSAGFSTIVHPAASAGATFSITWFIGQFQGVIRAQTPTGSYRIMSPGAWSPKGRSKAKPFAVRMVFFKCPAPAPTCAVFANVIGAPISELMACAMSSAWPL